MTQNSPTNATLTRPFYDSGGTCCDQFARGRHRRLSIHPPSRVIWASVQRLDLRLRMCSTLATCLPPMTEPTTGESQKLGLGNRKRGPVSVLEAVKMATAPGAEWPSKAMLRAFATSHTQCCGFITRAKLKSSVLERKSQEWNSMPSDVREEEYRLPNFVRKMNGLAPIGSRGPVAAKDVGLQVIIRKIVSTSHYRAVECRAPPFEDLVLTFRNQLKKLQDTRTAHNENLVMQLHEATKLNNDGPLGPDEFDDRRRELSAKQLPILPLKCSNRTRSVRTFCNIFRSRHGASGPCAPRMTPK